MMPLDGANVYATRTDIAALLTAKICTSAMYNLVEIKRNRMSCIIRYSKTTGIAAFSKNKGQSTAIQHDDPSMAPLQEHFHELKGLGEVRVTCFVHALVAGWMEQVTRDVDNGKVYLPATHGCRPMYYRYICVALDGLYSLM